MLRQKWQWPLLTMLRQTGKTPERRRLSDTGDTRYREGLVTHVHKGEVPTRSQRFARYLAQEVVSPPIALRRIDRDEGQRVPYHDRAHTSDRVEWDTGAVSTCSGRMVHHAFAKGCQGMRYDGVQAPKTFAKLQGVMQAAWAQGQGFVKEASKRIAPMTSRQRYQQRTGRDP